MSNRMVIDTATLPPNLMEMTSRGDRQLFAKQIALERESMSDMGVSAIYENTVCTVIWRERLVE
jgi:hypothetical protein